MLQYHIWTIGCQMNRSESERLGSYLEDRGYRSTDTIAEADLIVLNGCVVRQSAENRVLNKLNDLKTLKTARPGITLAVTGCSVNSEVDKLKKGFSYVDYFFKPGVKPPWMDEASLTSVLTKKPSPAVFVPIIQGCDNYCSYCIVPYRRGREISRPILEILCEVKELINRGVKEITLLGQNVDSYGHDLPSELELADLLVELNNIDGLARIRFLTNHPKDMSHRLIEVIASLDKVCGQIYIPVQSGSDDILKLMRRGYTVKQYRHLIDFIRSTIPDIALSTDVIVGFPSESESQFQKTVELLSDLKYDTVHVAAYSPRPETLSARELTDNIPLSEKKRRLAEIEHLQEKIATVINANLFNKNVEVLVEQKKKEKWEGRTRSGKLVFFSDSSDWLGRLVHVKVVKTSPWSLQGKLTEVNYSTVS